jgi:hypothetical protein
VKAEDATAEVFITAFRALSRPQRDAILRRLLESPAVREDLVDILAWLERKRERAISYRRVRERLRQAGRL